MRRAIRRFKLLRGARAPARAGHPKAHVAHELFEVGCLQRAPELDLRAGIAGTVAFVLDGYLRLEGLRLRRGEHGWLVLEEPNGRGHGVHVRIVDPDVWAHVEERVVATPARQGALPAASVALASDAGGGP